MLHGIGVSALSVLFILRRIAIWVGEDSSQSVFSQMHGATRTLRLSEALMWASHASTSWASHASTTHWQLSKRKLEYSRGQAYTALLQSRSMCSMVEYLNQPNSQVHSSTFNPIISILFSYEAKLLTWQIEAVWYEMCYSAGGPEDPTYFVSI